MHGGLECGSGWIDILDHLCYALSNMFSTGFYIDNEFVNVEPPQVVMDQVKEKFGTLRVYNHLEFPDSFREQAKMYPDAKEIADRYSEYVDGIVHMAESMSERTCEETGLPGEMHVTGNRHGWYKTLNREFAKIDPFCVSRGYVPVADLPKEEEIKMENGSTITTTETPDAVRGSDEVQ